jgi:hypothetical protein
MAFSFRMDRCPQCQQRHVIYVNEDDIPNPDMDHFHFECPESHEEVEVSPGFVIANVTIPPAGVIVAERTVEHEP